MSNPSLTRFCVELSDARALKLRTHILNKHENNGRKFMEKVVDNIAQVQKALDATCAKPSRAKK